MRLERFYSKFKGKTAAGVFLQMYGEEVQVSTVLLQEKDKGIVIDKFWNDDDLEIAISRLPNHVSVFLVIDGKGIVTRKISGNSAENVIGQLFPNINATEVASFECSNFVSIARNDTLQDYIALMTLKGVSVTNVYLGTALLSEGYGQLTVKESDILVNSLLHNFENDELVDISRVTPLATFPLYEVDGQQLNGSTLVAFSAALRFWTAEHIDDGIINSSIEVSRSNFLYNLATRKLLPWVGIPLFCLLLFNFFLYSDAFEKNSRFKTELRNYQSSISTYDALKKGYDTRVAFAKKNSLSGHTRNSFYFDQISAIKPSAIVLTKMENCPSPRKIHVGETPLFQPDLLYVSGSVNSGQVLNEWIKDLRELSWVAEIKVNSFEMKENSSASVFVLHIKKRGL